MSGFIGGGSSGIGRGNDAGDSATGGQDNPGRSASEASAGFGTNPIAGAASVDGGNISSQQQQRPSSENSGNNNPHNQRFSSLIHDSEVFLTKLREFKPQSLGCLEARRKSSSTLIFPSPQQACMGQPKCPRFPHNVKPTPGYWIECHGPGSYVGSTLAGGLGARGSAMNQGGVVPVASTSGSAQGQGETGRSDEMARMSHVRPSSFSMSRDQANSGQSAAGNTAGEHLIKGHDKDLGPCKSDESYHRVAQTILPETYTALQDNVATSATIRRSNSVERIDSSSFYHVDPSTRQISDTKFGTESELLTLRILEASERKMQMIRELLTPEECGSLPSDLFANDYNSWKDHLNQAIKQRRAQLSLTRLNSIPTDLNLSHEDKDPRLSKSYTDLGRSSAKLGDLDQGKKVKEFKQAKRQSAIEFFFQDNNEPKRTELLIEFKSGLSFMPEDEPGIGEELMTKVSFNLISIFQYLAAIFNIFVPIRNSKMQGVCINQQPDDDFSKRYRDVHSYPFSSEQNIQVMKQRLELDHQLDRVLQLSTPSSRITSNEPDRYQIVGKEANNLNRLKTDPKSDNISTPLQSMAPIRHPYQDSRILSLGSKVKTFDSLFKFKRLPRLYGDSELELMSSSRSLTIRLDEMRVTSHKLLPREIELGEKLRDNFSAYLEIYRGLCSINHELVANIDALIRMVTIRERNLSKLGSLCELKLKFLEYMTEKHEELLMIYNQMEAIRSEQNYTMTQLRLVPREKQDIGQKILVGQSRVNDFSSSCDKKCNPNVVAKMTDLMIKSDQTLRLLELSETGPITKEQDVASEECLGINDLSKWCKSLLLKLEIEGKVHDLSIGEQENHKNRIKFKDKTLSIRLPRKLQDNVNFKLTLLAKDSQICFGRTEARGGQVLSPHHIRRASRKPIRLKIELLSQQSDIRVQLRVTICCEEVFHSSRSRHVCSLVEKLCDLYFTQKHPFDNMETKINKLFNRIDPISMMTYSQTALFQLNPYSDQLVCSKNTGQVRLRLLVERWFKDTDKPVFLNDRENINKYKIGITAAPVMKSKLERPKERDPPGDMRSGYKLIENGRREALEFIRELEQHLETLLLMRLHGQESSSLPAENSQCLRLGDVLVEPRMMKINFPNLVHTMRLLKPRKSARRPLMARRRTKGASSAIAKWATLRGLERNNLSSSDMEMGAAAGVVDKWKQLTTFRANGVPSRLVVTIQQATNVPFRLNRQQTGGYKTALSRSVSPIVPSLNLPTTDSLSLIMNGGGTFNRLGPPALSSGFYLSEPTTYVEITFLRQQSATSLAQGQNPAWNETLFFDLNNHPASSRLLADEFVQLNVYDFRCYTQPITSMNSNFADQQPTLALSSKLSTLNMSNNLSTNSTGVFAQKQKIERQLIGSLRISLATLLSSGRVEGSFALLKPIMMDNYQFVANQSEQETYLNLFITLDPPINEPLAGETYYLQLESGATYSHEAKVVLDYARQWEKTMSQFYPSASLISSSPGSALGAEGRNRRGKGRHVRALVLRANTNRYSLISRLIYPIEAPHDLPFGPLEGLQSDGEKQLVEDAQTMGSTSSNNRLLHRKMVALARFVSLLDPIKYGHFQNRALASCLWFSCDQLLSLKRLGGNEEKAVLLCNYFLSLGKCSAILLGDSIDLGRCAYVIVWHEQSRFIDEQLHSQVANLLESINPILENKGDLDEQDSNLRQESLFKRQKVDDTNFMARLPVLITARSVQLWNVSTGENYKPGDQRLQLVSVGSIVTCENCYANIQQKDSPSQVNFDIRLRQFWSPLFVPLATSLHQQNQPISINLDKISHLKPRRQLILLDNIRKQIGRPSLKPTKNIQLDYRMFSREQCDKLATDIEQSIKSHLMMWRPNRPTYFNRIISKLVHEKLSTLELSEVNQSGWRTELAELLRNEVLNIPSEFNLRPMGNFDDQHNQHSFADKQMISWPANLSFTSMKSIIEQLYASGVHNADLMFLDDELVFGQKSTINVQFLVACHVQPYPAHVMSVWLYVGAIVSNKSRLKGQD